MLATFHLPDSWFFEESGIRSHAHVEWAATYMIRDVDGKITWAVWWTGPQMWPQAKHIKWAFVACIYVSEWGHVPSLPLSWIGMSQSSVVQFRSHFLWTLNLFGVWCDSGGVQVHFYPGPGLDPWTPKRKVFLHNQVEFAWLPGQVHCKMCCWHFCGRVHQRKSIVFIL